MTRVDLRFWDVPLELSLLEEYLDILDNQLAPMIEREREKIWENVARDDREQEDAALYRQHYLDDGISIRFLTAAAVIGVWAEYEAGVTKLGQYLRTARGLELEISDLRGGFLEAARRYYDQVLRMPLHPPHADWDRLRTIALVRHALAHANGRLADVEAKKRKSLQDLVAKNSALIVREGYLIVSRRYAREALAFIRGLLEDLNTRVEHEVSTIH